MYIEGRKQKACSEKLAAEVTLYILISRDYAVMADAFDFEFGNPSERTMYRYTRDIERCGYAPRIIYDDGEYTVGLGEELERVDVPHGDDAHIRRLARIFEIYDRYAGRYYDALYPDGGDYEDGLTEEPICVELKASEVLAFLQEKHPEERITLRTVQRDLAVIAEALEHYRNIYL